MIKYSLPLEPGCGFPSFGFRKGLGTRVGVWKDLLKQLRSCCFVILNHGNGLFTYPLDT